MKSSVTESSAELISQLRLKLLSFLNAAKIIWSTDGKILKWSPEAQKLIGYSEKEVISKKKDIYIPSEIVNLEEQAAIQHHKEGKFYFNDHTLRKTKNNEIFSAVVYIKPILNGNNDVISFEESLFSLNDLLKIQELIIMAMEYSPTGKILADREGNILIANKRALQEFGYLRSEISNKKIHDLLPSLVNEKYINYGKDSIEHLTGAGHEVLGRRKNGSEFPTEVGLTSVNSKNETYLMISIIDITDRKRIEDYVRSNKDLEKFIFVASHDLQTPLRHISSYTEFLSEKYSKLNDEETNKWLNYIAKGATSIRLLINSLLEYILSGTITAPVENKNIDLIIKHIIMDLEDIIKKYDVKIAYDTLPSILTKVDIRTVLNKLISNAIKFKKNGTSPYIEIKAVKKNDWWEFMVSDNGIGIEPKYHEKIFEIFQRLNPQIEGTGISIPICKKIIELNGGRIWLESEPDKGSKFFFTVKDLSSESVNE